MLLGGHDHKYSRFNRMSCYEQPSFCSEVRELHTLEGLFCFLDFRLDLCFEPPDFVFFREKRQKEKKVLATEEE